MLKCIGVEKIEGLRGPISNTRRLKTTESMLASEEKKKDTVCLQWPVENTDRYVFCWHGLCFYSELTDRQPLCTQVLFKETV